MTGMAVQRKNFDEAKAEAFFNSMGTILDHGAIAIMTSVGHRTKLFETMANLPPSKSVQIAEQAELSERYVREWLAVMVTGGIVEY